MKDEKEEIQEIKQCITDLPGGIWALLSGVLLGILICGIGVVSIGIGSALFLALVIAILMAKENKLNPVAGTVSATALIVCTLASMVLLLVGLAVMLVQAVWLLFL